MISGFPCTSFACRGAVVDILRRGAEAEDVEEVKEGLWGTKRRLEPIET